ncbi:MAG: hypothetical protein ACI97A_003141 [Planctomycetota bacterium]|jgi:hypothetical protein
MTMKPGVQSIDLESDILSHTMDVDAQIMNMGSSPGSPLGKSPFFA